MTGPQHAMLIDGVLRSDTSDATISNPATGATVGTAPNCSPENLDRAFASAATAFGAWAADLPARRQVLAAMAETIRRHRVDLIGGLTAEEGKPLAESTFEVDESANILDFYASAPIPHSVLRDNDEMRIDVTYEPLGVVAAITPWNYPLLLAIAKIGPALLAGNTFVLKPSPLAPLTSLRFAALVRDVCPAGVLNVVTGGDDLGAAMTSHPVPRVVSFTGSEATGRLVAAAAGRDLKRVTLELGGNDAAVILDDADIAAVAPKIVTAAFENCGQVCAAIKRVFVPDHLHDPFVEALLAEIRALHMGDGSDPAVDLGPMISATQRQRVDSMVQEAVAQGAQLLTGGAPVVGPGFFYEPTLLLDAPAGSAIVDEEQFGPALPVLRYRSIDDAVRAANATRFGLSGSVWGADVDRASAVAQQLICGTRWVNTHHAVPADQPFGGAKCSGIGFEGVLGYTQLHVTHRAL